MRQAAPWQPLEFVPTPRLWRLALVAALAVGAAVVTARGGLAVVAAAPLVLLAASPRTALPGAASVACRLDQYRCVEDDELELVVEVTVAGADRVEAALSLPTHTTATGARSSTVG